MRRFHFNSTVRVAVGGTGIVLLALTTPVAVAADKPQGADSSRHSAQVHRTRSPFFRAVHELKLTPEQRTGIRSILTASRQQHAASAQSGRPDFAALLNPGSPNHAVAVQAAQTRAAARVQQRSEIETSVYDLLTPDQKAQLQTVLAGVQTQMQQRRERHQNQGKPA
jgi:Spy/CpxP family protein refolding chaperone